MPAWFDVSVARLRPDLLETTAASTTVAIEACPWQESVILPSCPSLGNDPEQMSSLRETASAMPTSRYQRAQLPGSRFRANCRLANHRRLGDRSSGEACFHQVIFRGNCNCTVFKRIQLDTAGKTRLCHRVRTRSGDSISAPSVMCQERSPWTAHSPATRTCSSFRLAATGRTF